MINIIYRLLSESLLSLYPSFIKKIPISLDKQLLSRMAGFAIVPMLFMTYNKQLLDPNALILSAITFVHVWLSYKGFIKLDSGIAYALFYTYPLMLLYWSTGKFNINYLIAFAGILLLTLDTNPFSEKIDMEKIQGVIYILGATITEVMIYYAVKRVKTDNSWNLMFISYFPAFIIFGIYYLITKGKELVGDIDGQKILGMVLLFNMFIGCVGYFLRFYTIKKLSTKTYVILSFFGVITAYIYGVIFENEKITIKDIIGTGLILFSNYKLSVTK